MGCRLHGKDNDLVRNLVTKVCPACHPVQNFRDGSIAHLHGHLLAKVYSFPDGEKVVRLAFYDGDRLLELHVFQAETQAHNGLRPQDCLRGSKKQKEYGKQP